MTSSTKTKTSQPKRKRKAKPKRNHVLSPEQIEMHRALYSLRKKIRAGSLRGTSKTKSPKKSKAKP